METFVQVELLKEQFKKKLLGWNSITVLMRVEPQTDVHWTISESWIGVSSRLSPCVRCSAFLCSAECIMRSMNLTIPNFNLFLSSLSPILLIRLWQQWNFYRIPESAKVQLQPEEHFWRRKVWTLYVCGLLIMGEFGLGIKLRSIAMEYWMLRTKWVVCLRKRCEVYKKYHSLFFHTD